MSEPIQTRPFAPFEWLLSGRYLRARRKEGFISVNTMVLCDVIPEAIAEANNRESLERAISNHSDHVSSRASALTGACWILVNLYNLAKAQASAGRGREFAANYLQIAA